MQGDAKTRGSVGGRHQRARGLARRRSDCEPLSGYEERLLDAHLGACTRCSGWAKELPEPTVPAGQEAQSPATVSGVEAASTAPDSRDREDERERDHEHIGPQEDAMGLDKRRSVVGQGYGPSKGRQFLYYGIFIVVIILLYFGGKAAVSALDQAPSHNPATAPWAQPPANKQPQPEQFQ